MLDGSLLLAVSKSGPEKSFELTVAPSQVPSTQTDFNAYIDLSILETYFQGLPSTRPDFFGTVRSDGGDIRIFKSDHSTELPRQVVQIDVVARTGSIKLEADSIANASVFYIDWDGFSNEPAADSTYGSEEAWGNNYAGSYQMNDPSPGTNIADSSAAGRDLTDIGTLVDGDSVPGLVDQAIEFEASKFQGAENAADPFPTGYPFTFEAVAFANIDSTDQAIMGVSSTITASKQAQISINSANKGNMNIRNEANRNITMASALSSGWHHFVGRFVSNTSRIFYVDGVLIGSNGTNITYHADIDIFTVGYWNSVGTPFNHFNDKIDEVRIIDADVSADWVTARFNNLMANATFWTVGDV